MRWKMLSVGIGLHREGGVTALGAENGELLQLLGLGMTIAKEHGAGLQVPLDHHKARVQITWRAGINRRIEYS